MQDKISGSWSLHSFEIEDKTGKRSPWGKNSRGLLIYAPSGEVSVAINRDVDSAETGNKFESIYDSILFYAGTYRMEGNLIRHQVTLASNPDRVGKEMIRFAKLDGDLLTVSTPEESFGKAILVWKRIPS